MGGISLFVRKYAGIGIRQYDDNLVELVAAKLPADAKIIAQTGGAGEWKTKGIAPDALERWSIEDGQMKKLGTLENASMGSAQTLSDFLSFCRSTYPAKKEALIFGDHGGGSLPGVLFLK